MLGAKGWETGYLSCPTVSTSDCWIALRKFDQVLYFVWIPPKGGSLRVGASLERLYLNFQCHLNNRAHRPEVR